MSQKNESRNSIGRNPDGSPIPNFCVVCLEPSNYGRNGIWFCTEHYYEEWLEKHGEKLNE